MKQSIFILIVLWVVSIVGEISPVFGQTEFHGADSIFEREGITILWAILKGPTEESSWVYIKIIQTGGGLASFQLFRVEAVDPFSNQKEWVVKGEPLKRENTVKSIRTSFREKTGRRILFYRSKGNDQAEKPAMAVYYLSVPDTSPELLSEKEIEDYFVKALERIKTR